MYITAEWCRSCSLNEERVIKEYYTREFFYDNGIEVLVADSTEENKEANQLMDLYYHPAPPFHLYYPPKSGISDGIKLPQNLTSSSMVINPILSEIRERPSTKKPHQDRVLSGNNELDIKSHLKTTKSKISTNSECAQFSQKAEDIVTSSIDAGIPNHKILNRLDALMHSADHAGCLKF